MSEPIANQITDFINNNKALNDSELINKLYRHVKDIKYGNNTELLDNYKAEPFSMLVDKEYEKCVDPVNKVKSGVSTGYAKLDETIGGFSFGELVIIGSRPGMGKTQFALNLCVNLLENTIPVALFSYELGRSVVFKRLLGIISEIGQQQLRNISEMISDKVLRKNVDEMKKWPLFIEDTPYRFHEFIIIAEKLIKAEGVQVIFVDYLQLLSNSYSGYHREQDLSFIIKELKKLAKRNNVVLICLSQLSRQVENRPGGSKRPQLSDLRESGSIEQDSDKVLFVYRAEYYGFEIDENNEPTKNKIEIIVAKNRDGATGEITHLYRDLGFSKFKDANEINGKLTGFKNEF